MAMALWPTRALADQFMIDLSDSRLRIYDCYTSSISDDTLAEDIGSYPFKEFWREITNLQYQEIVNLSVGTGTVNGYISPSTEYTEVYWKSALFDGADESLSNPPLVLYIPLGSTVLPQGYRFRVSYPHTAWVLRWLNGSNYVNTTFSATVVKAYSGTSLADLVECGQSNGGFVAQKSSRLVVLVLSTNNRTGARLTTNHQYQFYGNINFQIEIPDPTAEQINEQSVINTEEITDTIATQTETQTNQLKDTTGSNSIVGPATTQGQNVFENLSLVTTMEGAFDNINQAISTQDSDTGIPFPGMQMAGFVIPSYNVDPTQMMPEIMPYVKGMLTFVFCCAFLSHIVHLIQAIFGIYDYGEMVLDDHVPDVGYTVSKKFRPDYDIDEDLGF